MRGIAKSASKSLLKPHGLLESQMPPSSPLTLDVSKVASARFQGHLVFFVFYVLEKDGRNNCKMLPKLEVEWIHENVKCDKKS